MKMINTVTLCVALLCGGSAHAMLNRLYKIDASKVNKDAVTTPLIDNTAFGTCNCDRTLNSCDAYCCCDQDCSTAILDFWRSNYDQYCARSYAGGREYKPFQQCIDAKHVFNYKKRMGMEVSQQNGQLCVEMDTGSMFSAYAEYIPEINQTYIDNLNVKYDVAKILHSTQSRRASSSSTIAFQKGDPISVNRDKQVQNFPLPMPSSDGSCNSFSGATFLKNTQGTCQQKVTNMQSQCSTVLSPQYFTKNFQYFKGGLVGSVNSNLAQINIGKVYVDDGAGGLTQSSLQDSTLDEANCGCLNALKEIRYSVYYSQNDGAQYSISSITADIVMYQQVQVKSDYCNGMDVYPPASMQ